MPAWFEKLKTNLGLQEEEPSGTQGLLQQLDEATTLSRTQRLVGFATCFGIGLLLSFLSPLYLVRPTKFAVLYSFGNILSLVGSCFLMGPWKQVKTMFDGKRVISTSIYIVSLVFTLIAALKFHSVILCLFFIIIQFCAFIWYCLSYVPFAQAMVMKMFGWQPAEGGV